MLHNEVQILTVQYRINCHFFHIIQSDIVMYIQKDISPGVAKGIIYYCHRPNKECFSSVSTQPF